MASTKRRSSLNVAGEYDLDLQWFVDKLTIGKCEITGIQFDFNEHPLYSKNPFSPSIDRVDSLKGYSKENCRVVLWQVNLARGEMNDSDIVFILEKMLEGLHERST